MNCVGEIKLVDSGEVSVWRSSAQKLQLFFKEEAVRPPFIACWIDHLMIDVLVFTIKSMLL
jgi:hypothetical protein